MLAVCESRIDSVQRLFAVAMWIPELRVADVELDFCFPLVIQFGRSIEDFLSVQVRAELDSVASSTINESSDLATDFAQARVDLIVNLQIFYTSLVGFQAYVFPRPTSGEDWAPIPAAESVSYDRFK